MLSPVFVGSAVKMAMNLTLAILLPVVCHQWSVSLFQETLGLSIIYSGMTVGLLLQSLADKWGRKKVVLLAAVLDVISLLGLLAWNW